MRGVRVPAHRDHDHPLAADPDQAGPDGRILAL
jgi:hypothetical protein